MTTLCHFPWRLHRSSEKTWLVLDPWAPVLPRRSGSVRRLGRRRRTARLLLTLDPPRALTSARDIVHPPQKRSIPPWPAHRAPSRTCFGQRLGTGGRQAGLEKCPGTQPSCFSAVAKDSVP